MKNTTMTGIMASWPTYESYIPYAGTMTLTGTDIRSYTVRFSTDSPTTGVVEVSINGSPYFEVDLDEL